MTAVHCDPSPAEMRARLRETAGGADGFMRTPLGRKTAAAANDAGSGTGDHRAHSLHAVATGQGDRLATTQPVALRPHTSQSSTDHVPPDGPATPPSPVAAPSTPGAAPVTPLLGAAPSC